MIHLKRLGYGIIFMAALLAVVGLGLWLTKFFHDLIPLVLFVAVAYCIGGSILEYREGK